MNDDLQPQLQPQPGQWPDQNAMAQALWGQTGSPLPAAKFVGQHAANALGITDAVRALRGEMSPWEAQDFAIQSAIGAALPIPGAKLAKPALKAAGRAAEAIGAGPALKTMSMSGAFNPQSVARAYAHIAKEGDVPMPFLGHGTKHPLSPDLEPLPKPWAIEPQDQARIAKYGDVPSDFDLMLVQKHQYRPAVDPVDQIFSNHEEYNKMAHEGVPPTLPTQISPRAAAAGYNVPLAHGTKAGEVFHEFALPEEMERIAELGIHAGSPTAANTFATQPALKGFAPRVYPLVMKAQNPLELPDLGSWGPGNIAKALQNIHKDKFTDFEIERAMDARHPEDQIQNLRGLIRSKGYDSVKYINDTEDPGHTSYIALHPSQFRSPWAKFEDLQSRNLLAGLAGGAAAAPVVGSQVKNMVDALKQPQQ